MPRVGARTLLTLLLVSLLVLSVVPWKASAASIIVNPITSLPQPGGYLIIDLLNFPKNSTIYILLDNGTLLGVTVTDKWGLASANVSIPLHVRPGDHEVVAVFANGTTLVVAKTTVTIDPAPQVQFYEVEVETGGYAAVNETVTFLVLVKTRPQGEPVDADQVRCTLYSPNGSTKTINPDRIGTGLYQGSFLPVDPGSYGLVCNAQIGVFTVSSISTIHVSDIQWTILGSLAKGYANLTSLINQSTASILVKLAAVEANITNLINEVNASIIKKINITENNITISIIAALKESEANLTAHAASIYALVDSSNTSIHNAISTAYTALAASIDEINASISDLTLYVKGAYANITLYISSNASTIIESLSQRISQSESNISTTVQAEASYLAEVIASAEENISLLVQDESGTIQVLIKARISSAEQNITNVLNSIQDSIATAIALITAANQSLHTLIINKTGEIIAYINGTVLAQLNNLTVTVESNLTGVLIEKYKSIMDNINTSRTQLSALVTSRTGDIIALINGLSDKVDFRYQLLASLIASANQSLQVLITSNTGDVLQAIDSVAQEVAGMNQSLHSLIREKAAEILLNLSEKYDSLYGLVSTSNATIIGEIKNAAGFLDSAIKAAKESLEGNLTIKIEASKGAIMVEIGNSTDEVLAAIASANESLRGLILNESDRVVGNIWGAQKVLKIFIMNVSQSLEANLTLAIADATGDIVYEISMANFSVTQLILTKSGEILATLTNGTMEVTALIGNVSSSLSQQIATAEANISSMIARLNLTLTALINGKVQALRGEVLGVINESTVALLNELAASTAQINATILGATAEVKTAIGDLSALVNLTGAKLENVIVTGKGEILGVIRTANETILLRLDELNGSLAQSTGALQEKLDAVLAKLTQTENSLLEQIQKSADEVKSVASNYGVSSTTASVITLLAVSGLAIFMRKA